MRLGCQTTGIFQYVWKSDNDRADHAVDVFLYVQPAFGRGIEYVGERPVFFRQSLTSRIHVLQ